MNETIGTYIVDDEFRAIASVRRHAEARSDLSILGSATDPYEALAQIPQLDVQLVFVDMKMEGMSGLKFIEALGASYTYICCTAYDDYGPKIALLDVNSYLLKPINPDEFNTVVDLCLKNRELKLAGKRAIATEELAKEGRLEVTVRNSKEALFIPYASIEVLRGDEDETIIYCADRDYIVAGRFGKFVSELPDSLFTRTHRSFIVANRVVEAYCRPDSLRLKEGSKMTYVKLSESFKADVLEKLNLKGRKNDESDQLSA